MSTPEQTTATTMLAERFYAATKEIKLEHIPIPTPGPGEVLIKVAYCGICHSDLSLIDGNSRPEFRSSLKAMKSPAPLPRSGPA